MKSPVAYIATTKDDCVLRFHNKSFYFDFVSFDFTSSDLA